MLDNSTRNVINRALKSKDFLTRVSLGKVEGWATVNKFGGGLTTLDERIIRDGMEDGPYPFLIDENKEMTVQSTDVLDTGRPIRIVYTEYDPAKGDATGYKCSAWYDGALISKEVL